MATGRLGADGGWADWLANNIYPIEVVGDKGISSGPVPMDNYLADLNSGQAMYRPVTVLVLVLGDPRVPAAAHAAFQGFFLDYWCRRIDFDRASHNSTEMSLDVLRRLGWQVPKVGGTSWLKGLVAAAGALVVTQSLEVAGDAWSFFTEERSDLFPRVAFEEAAGDLLALVGDDPPPLTALEERIREDAEALLFLRFPQIPSSRPFGTYPVASVREYRARVGLSQIGLDPDPPTPRPFPDRLRQRCRGDR